MANLLPTIVLFIALFLSIILYIRIKMEVKQRFNNDDWYVTPIMMFIVCILWSYLFYLLH